MRLIGQRCKHGDVFSLLVLIGRGLDLLLLTPLILPLFGFQGFVALKKYIVGVNCYEDPPVPIPNTEVKLIYVENTWLVTAREDRTMPTQKSKEINLTLLTYSSIAQSVEHAAVNRRVVGSSPTWGAKAHTYKHFVS